MRAPDWLRRQAGQVPPEDAAGEFACRRTTCRQGEWDVCQHRFRGGLPADAAGAPPKSGSGTAHG